MKYSGRSRTTRPRENGSLLADENFPGPTTDHLRRLGHDVLTAREAGNADQQIPDQHVLDFAIQQSRTLLTVNRRDFIQLHGTTPGHCGIVVCTEDADFVRLGDRVHSALEGIADLRGRLIRVVRPG